MTRSLEITNRIEVLNKMIDNSHLDKDSNLWLDVAIHERKELEEELELIEE